MSPWLRYLQWIPGIRKICYRWSVTQAFDVTEQLRLGIRYFDFRVSHRGKFQFEIVHGLYGSEIGNLLVEIVRFLESHPKEVLL